MILHWNKRKLVPKKPIKWQLFLLCLPALIYFIVFKYIPMYGVQIAFKDFLVSKGITGSPWVGLKHFTRFFNSYFFWPTIRNTLLLSFAEVILTFPLPILVAIQINQLRSKRLRSFVQTAIYSPYFISIVVMVGMLRLFLSPSNGLINNIIKGVGRESVFFFGKSGWFVPIFVLSSMWQLTGYRTIVALGALTSINPELHEAAVTEGASKLQRIIHIDLPGIMPIVMPLQILAFGRIMSIGFQKTLLMQTPLNLSASEIITTYVYKAGVVSGQYSFAAAIGLFENIVNILLLIFINKAAKKVANSSLW